MLKLCVLYVFSKNQFLDNYNKDLESIEDKKPGTPQHINFI